MKQLQTFILTLAISLLAIPAFGQQDSIAIETDKLIVEDSAVKDSLSKGKTGAGKLFVGVDLFNPLMSAFGKKQGGVGVVSYRVYKKWNAVLELGYEKNEFNELDWDVDVSGLFFKLGFNWFLSQDYQDASNGFYVGARFAGSVFNQNIYQYPIRLSGNQVDGYGSLPSANISAYWIEIVGGGRIGVGKNFYIDVSVRPEIFIGGTKQEGIDPLVIPGYGKDSGPINFSVFWGITYKLF